MARGQVLELVRPWEETNMAEYKAGDKVKCEQNIDTPLTTTDIYTVREMLRQTGTDRYMLILEEFEHLGFWEYRFVKAQE